MKACRFLLLHILILTPLYSFASDFNLEKQKLKLSLEYENFIDINGNKISTSGLKAAYLLRALGDIQKKAYYSLDVQAGAKTNYPRQFQSGNLSPLTLSNRTAASITIPIKKFYAGGLFYYRIKWLANTTNEFVDVFGGEGYREIVGGVKAGYLFSAKWELSGGVQTSDVNFNDFPLSNYNWIGANVRLARKLGNMSLNVDYRTRNVDYARPVFSDGPIIVFPSPIELQRDHFWEIGAGVELSRSVFVSGGYWYQQNGSNNPGFDYTNHEIRLVFGRELGKGFHFQAYGIIRSQDFPHPASDLPFPVLLEEAENNTMVFSIVKVLSNSRELEVGFQRLHNNSSFSELDVSKNVLYGAYAFRF